MPQIRLVIKWASRGSLPFMKMLSPGKSRWVRVSWGTLPVREVDLGVDTQAADDAGDRVPGHLDQLAALRGGFALGGGYRGHGVAPWCNAPELAASRGAGFQSAV